jgi:tRNA-(ms[2]io[6]A)-hydroxylase
MAVIAQEEMSHFEMVHNIMLKRDIVMDRERKDQYGRDLHQFFPIRAAAQID